MATSETTKLRWSIAQHIATLQARGIGLDIVDGKLQVLAPLGALSDEDRAFIAANRDLIFRHLDGEQEMYTL